MPLTVTMGYNADGQRARYTVTMSGTATLDERFGYRGGQLAQMAAMTATLTSGGAIQSTGAYTDSYVYGANDAPLELLRQRGSATNRYWYTLDGRGNVVALTDSTGAVVDRYAYDPYGENLPEGTSETVPQQLRYASYWVDAALGWYWVGARSYDPEGRWVQPDPSQADGLRTYVYADDDPVDETDALGLGGICDVPLFGGAACAVGALAHGAYDLIAGDDIKTLQSRHASGVDKFLAVVDLTSNLLTFVPIGGEGIVAAKLAAKAALKLGSRGIVKEVSYEGAVQIVKRLGRRGARGAVEGAAEACALCFPAGTLVATPHGMHAIQTLHVGDTVLSEDPTTGKVEAEAVQAVIADPVSPLIAVDLSDGSAITVTADHPFWLDHGLMAPRAGWIAAGDLVLGDRLRTPTGTDATVLGVRRGVGRAAVYTLTVARDHTFFVGTAQVLVHNSNCDRSLIDVLKREGVKFTEQDIAGILRTTSGRVVFLERGTVEAGLMHILEGHTADFAAKGVASQEEIVNLILDTLRTETPVRTVGKSGLVYNVVAKGRAFLLTIVVGSNGFIVTAYPSS